MTRYFEFVNGSSAKFWEGRDVTVRFGRIGISGQSQTKTLPSAAAASKHAEQLIAQKLDKGYVETQLA